MTKSIWAPYSRRNNKSVLSTPSRSSSKNKIVKLSTPDRSSSNTKSNSSKKSSSSTRSKKTHSPSPDPANQKKSKRMSDAKNLGKSAKKSNRCNKITIFGSSFQISDCSEIPYMEDQLHDDIIQDHFQFKTELCDIISEHCNTFYKNLKNREEEILAKINSSEDELQNNKRLLEELEAEYEEKGQSVIEYERALAEFEICKQNLSQLDERAYAFLKAMIRPPPVFHHIIAGCLLVLGSGNIKTKKTAHGQTSWEDCRHFLLSSDSRKQMINFDPEQIDFVLVGMFADWMEQHPESFTYKRAERVSKVALLLLKWLLSLFRVSEQVRRFQELKGQAQDTITYLQKLKKRIKRLKHVIDNFGTRMKNWEVLLNQIQTNQKKIDVIRETSTNKQKGLLQNPPTAQVSAI